VGIHWEDATGRRRKAEAVQEILVLPEGAWGVSAVEAVFIGDVRSVLS